MPKEQRNQDTDRKERIRKNRARRRMYTLTRVMFLMFFLVFLGTGVSLGLRVYQDWRDAKSYEELNQLITEPQETEPAVPTESRMPELPTDPEEPTGAVSGPETNDPQILAKYRTVYGMNQDMYGWLSIDGIPFSYPVMYTPEEEERYLRRGFDGSYARSGVPFIDKDCQPGTANYVIYGHNMTNGTMFAQLLAYEDQEFWKEHPVIGFDTLYEEGEYEIISVFYSRVFMTYEKNVFRFYNYTDLSDPDVFSEYVGNVMELSLYDTEVDVRYGDELITLITCSYESGVPNERFVVVARKRP